MPATLLRPLGFGEVLDGAFTLYRQHFAVFFTTALLVTIPTVVVSVLVTPDPGDPATAGLSLLLFLLVVAVATAIGWAALTWEVGRAITGKPLSVGDAYRHGLRAFLPLVGAAVIAYVLLMIVGMVLMVAGVLLALASAPLIGEGNVVIVVTAVAGTSFVVLAVVVFATLFAVPAAVVLESRGPWSALKRSWWLAAGARLKVVGVVVISWMIVMLPTVGLYVVGAGAGLADLEGAAAPNPLWQMLEASAGLLIGALTYPFLVSAITLLYFERRVRKEAYDVELAAEGLAPSE